MKKIPFIVRVIALCVGAAFVAPLILMLFIADWRNAILGRGMVYGLAYSISIGVPSGLLLPLIAKRVGGPGARLALAIAASILVMAAVGCLVAGAFLLLVGYNSGQFFWRDYWFNLRITSLMALVFGMGSFFYEKLAQSLRETRVKLQEKELEQERMRKFALEAKLASLESRVHPHFLFNTLNSISALIPVDPRKAEQTVGQLATLLRSSLDNTRRRLIPLAEEMRIVKDYLEIEKARFGERLRYAFSMRDGTGDVLAPPLSVQSLVENAVKHGIGPQPAGGEIHVEMRLDSGDLRIEVSDSGPGFDLAGIEAGHGLDNLVSRLETIYNGAARLEVARRDGHCVVTMVVPRTPSQEPA